MKTLLNKDYTWFNKTNKYSCTFDFLVAAILIIQFLFNPFNILKTIGAEAAVILLAIFMSALGLFHYIDDRLSRIEDKAGLRIWHVSA